LAGIERNLRELIEKLGWNQDQAAEGRTS
jgi:hypothetical protein